MTRVSSLQIRGEVSFVCYLMDRASTISIGIQKRTRPSVAGGSQRLPHHFKKGGNKSMIHFLSPHSLKQQKRPHPDYQ